MIAYFKDRWTAARLNARYRRLASERLIELMEREGERSRRGGLMESGDWMPVGSNGHGLPDHERTDARSAARRLVLENPHAANLLRIMEIYVVGPGLGLSHAATDPAHNDGEILRRADGLWREFLFDNRRHFSNGEFARRTWRDGECFLRAFSREQWPPTVRFLDPEEIGPTRDEPDSQGVLTEPGDSETPVAYLHVDPITGDLLEQIPAEELFHARLRADSNQKRGTTLFAPLLVGLERFDKWLETELTARKLQASIVLWRKVQGPPSQLASLADSLASGGGDGSGGVRRERYRPGTIVTTSQGTDLQYLQPNTNFGDAVPLGRQLLLSLAAGSGLPEFMLTADAANANFSSTMVAEGPAVKLFQSEQEFFSNEFAAIWRWVMSEAVGFGLLPVDFFEQVRPEWRFPKLVTRDRPREREADARLVETGILSRAEIARRDGADPKLMQDEIAREQGTSTVPSAL